MSIEKQIEEMANVINDMDEPNAHYYDKYMEMHEAFADCFTIAKHLYKAGYRKQSEVIDDFIKRLLDAFPEPHRGGNLCPAIYYDDYREIIEECGAEMKGGAE